MTPAEAIGELNLFVNLLPEGASNRPSRLPGGKSLQPTYITIHNTANARRGADALMHARYIKGAHAQRREVSWHFTVDDVRCVQHLPANEVGWHALGGNGKSIGVEVCEHKGIEEEEAVRRAGLLTAILMFAFDIPPERVVPHREWTGKDCPRVLLRRAGGFAAFRAQAGGLLAEIEAESPGQSPASVQHWLNSFDGAEVIREALRRGEGLAPVPRSGADVAGRLARLFGQVFKSVASKAHARR